MVEERRNCIFQLSRRISSDGVAGDCALRGRIVTELYGGSRGGCNEEEEK